MLRRSSVLACIAVSFALDFTLAGAAASARTFATSVVTAAVPRGALGEDAGIDVAGGRYVRLTASGAIAIASYGACGRSVGPNGCAGAMSFGRLAPTAPTGSLIVAFVDATGRPVTSWSAVGDYAAVVVPVRAARMILRINGTSGREHGSFRVAADVVTAAADGSSVTSAGGVHRFAVQRQVATSTAFTRASAQYLLRRFGFSDTPANVTAVYAGGATAWLATQLDPASIDDSALATYEQPMPTLTGNSTVDSGFTPQIERRIVQREIASKRQLLEKLTLHWLEHFAVSQDKVNDIGAMAHYEDTIRADALGNFAQLVTDVSKEPAMLYWLDNNYNNGSNPAVSPPNENFGRELMQLYTVGETQLNPDGSNVIGANNLPVPNYGEPDVKAMALALTGFQVYSPYPEPLGVDPRTFDVVSFNAKSHATGPFTILGTQVIDPGNATIVDKCVAVLAHLPSTAPFEVTEMLQRLVTENPSPGYISRISAVWSANVDDPNQIAKVVQAIANDPEFYPNRNSMVKEPIEFSTDAVRALGGETANAATATDTTPLGQLQYDEYQMSETHYFPPSVFSFYRPGQKESLVTNSELLSRWNDAVNVSNSARVGTTCSTCQINLNLNNLATLGVNDVTQYLLDALVDGGTPELRSLVSNYLVGNPKNYPGAIWIIMTSPEYEVN